MWRVGAEEEGGLEKASALRRPCGRPARGPSGALLVLVQCLTEAFTGPFGDRRNPVARGALRTTIMGEGGDDSQRVNRVIDACRHLSTINNSLVANETIPAVHITPLLEKFMEAIRPQPKRPRHNQEEKAPPCNRFPVTLKARVKNKRTEVRVKLPPPAASRAGGPLLNL